MALPRIAACRSGRGTLISVSFIAMGLVLSGCNTSGRMPSQPVAPLIPVSATDLVGNWGLASYHNETDRERTEAQARVACSNPYRIGEGANGGVVMHLPDQTVPQEVFLKVSSTGQTFVGPRGTAGMKQDRLVTAFQNNVLITEWVDPGIRERYGTMLFVRCAA